MKVWLLWHSDVECSNLRGVYLFKELAEEAVNLTEARFYKSARGGHWSFEEHADWCCSVEEQDVLEAVEPQYHGPAVPYMGSKNEWGFGGNELGFGGAGLIPRGMVTDISRTFLKASPFPLQVPDGSGAKIEVQMYHDGAMKPIGTLDEIVEDENGITVRLKEPK